MTAPFASATLPAVEVRWTLSGPAGIHLDALVAGLICSGVSIEPIKPRERYRLNGSAHVLDSLAPQLAEIEGFDLAHEIAPADKVSMSTTVMPRPYQRSFIVHGVGPAYSFVARAVDRWLAVTTVGQNRWAVTGRTSALVAWVAEIYQRTPEEVLALFRIASERAEAEDSRVPMSVSVVSLPDRKTTSDIQRTADGSITTVVQVETSL